MNNIIQKSILLLIHFRKYKVTLCAYGDITDFYISPGIENLKMVKVKEKKSYYAKLNLIFSQPINFYFWLSYSPNNRDILSAYTKI